MKIAIIGGGIAGLTTALALEKLKIDYHVFEASPEINEVGAGIWLAPNALQVLEWLGLLQEIQGLGNEIEGMTLSDHKMQAFVGAISANIKAKFGFSTVAIHRAKLQRLLASKIPSSKLSLGKKFSAMINKDEGKEIRFQDGTSHIADALIGADGIHSAIRKMILPHSKVRYSGQTCWRGVSHTSLGNELQHKAYEMWGHGIRFGYSAIDTEKVYWFAVKKSARNQRDNVKTVKKELLDLYEAYHPLVHKLIAATPDEKILRNDIIDLRPMKTWYKEDICLIGDAGHSTTPNMGQGGAQAIEDAYYLSQLLDRHSDHREAFQMFYKLRRKKVNEIVKRSWMTGKVAHWENFVGFRNWIFKITPDAAMERQLMKVYELKTL